MTRTTLQKFSLAIALATGMLFTSTVSAQTENTPVAPSPSVVRGWIGEFNGTFPLYLHARAIAQALADEITAMRNFELDVTNEASESDVEVVRRVRRLIQLRLDELQYQYEIAQAQVDRLESMLVNVVTALDDWFVTGSNTLRSLANQQSALEEAYSAQKAIVVAYLDALENGRGDVNRRALRNAIANMQEISAQLDSVNARISVISTLADAAESVVTRWQAVHARRG